MSSGSESREDPYDQLLWEQFHLSYLGLLALLSADDPTWSVRAVAHRSCLEVWTWSESSVWVFGRGMDIPMIRWDDIESVLPGAADEVARLALRDGSEVVIGREHLPRWRRGDAERKRRFNILRSTVEQHRSASADG